jgi:ATP-dependent exoDNAse (exonuclease V) beta subunit
VESAIRHEERATQRPGDYIRLVETERIEDPTAATVRVMTVHQSKGLEFDIVVLPELDMPIYKGGGAAALPYRERETGPITKVFPYVGKEIRPLFEAIEKAYQQSRAPVLRDALSGLYVALTRARHALHIVLKPDGERGPGTAVTPARIVRDALAPERLAEEGDTAFFESGDPRWFEGVPAPLTEAAQPAPPAGVESPSATPPAVAAEGLPTGTAPPARPPEDPPGAAPLERSPSSLLRQDTPRRLRMLPRRTPSELEGGARVDLRHLLRLDTGKSLERGSVVHAWCQEIGWIEDGLPADDRLREIAQRLAPAFGDTEIEALIGEFRGWLADPGITAALSRGAYPEGAWVERETRFAHRDGDTIVEGIIDRLVLWTDAGGPAGAGRVAGAEVLDYKTDAITASDAEGLEGRTDFYRPQIAAYQAAVGGIYRLESERVRGRLIFLRAGVVRGV